MRRCYVNCRSRLERVSVSTSRDLQVLIQVVSELREIKEVIKMIETGSTERGENKPEAAERHIRRLEEINAQLAARIDELEGRRR
jgi:uncharacterized pyridoxal phosphate-containing UPF0001 family protein